MSNNHQTNTYPQAHTKTETHSQKVWKKPLWQFAGMPCWHFCFLCRPPDYNYRWRAFQLLSESNICMKTPAETLKHRKWNLSLKVSSEKRATPLFWASVWWECQGLHKLLFFFFCFPHRPLQFENKITLMTLLCSLLFFPCLCLKKRHIIIAAFYSKEQKIKRAINDLSDLAPTPVCLFVSHRPKNICHFSPASPTLHFSFYHSSISLLSDTQTVHVQAYTNAHA